MNLETGQGGRALAAALIERAPVSMSFGRMRRAAAPGWRLG